MSGPLRAGVRVFGEVIAAEERLLIRGVESVEGEVQGSNAVVRQEVGQGVKNGALEVENAVRAGQALPVAPRAGIWANAKAFGKWAGIEVGKGAVLAGGFELVGQIVKALEKKTLSDHDKARYDKVLVISETWVSLKTAKDGWMAWITANFGKRQDFGSTTLSTSDGESEQKFNIDRLSDKLTSLTEYGVANVDKALKAVEASLSTSTISEDKADKDIAALLYWAIKYADKQYKISEFCAGTTAEPMVKGGLKTYKSEVGDAKKRLTDAQTDQDRKYAEILKMGPA